MSEESRFNPREHLMQLKSREGDKDYLPVQWRLVWFREQCPQGSIETEMVHLDLTQPLTKEVSVWNSDKRRSDKVLKEMPGIAIFKATVRDGNGGVATGYGSESALDFGDFIEKAETKSIGRALAALGYGTQFAPELEEGARIVDAPVDRASSGSPESANNNAPEPASKDLIARAKELYAKVGRPWDPAIEQKSALAVRRLMEQAEGQYRNLLNKKNGHSATSQATQPTSTVNAPSPEALRKQAKDLNVSLEKVAIRALKANKPEGNWTPEDCARIYEFLNTVKEQQAKKAQSEQLEKAS